MKDLNYTTIEQSKHLLDLGLSLHTADMAYIEHSTSDNLELRFDAALPPMILCDVPIEDLTVNAIPCWSLAALRKLIPVGINPNKDETYLFVCNNRIDSSWVYCYVDESEIIQVQFTGSDLDACYQMICYLLENDFIK